MKNETLVNSLHNALKAWYVPGRVEDDELLHLQLFKQRRKRFAEENAAGDRLIINEVLLEAITQLSQRNSQSGRLLQERFLENRLLREVAQNLNMDYHTISRRQRSAVEELAEIILQQEESLQSRLVYEIEDHLPPSTYLQLFGVKEQKEQVVEQLMHDSTPYLIALFGIGGIGKTSLADAVVRQIIPTFRFDHIVWLRLQYPVPDNQSSSHENAFLQIVNGLAYHIWPDSYQIVSQQERHIQVRSRLKREPFLVIVDDLEVGDDIDYLLTYLRDLTNPSKFLLTTQTLPAGETPIFTLPLAELNETDSKALMRYHARSMGLSLDGATPADFAAIYERVGGNPLAIKLITGQLRDLSLNNILDRLVAQQSGDIEALYSRIYKRAWSLLTPAAKALLQSMQLVSEAGADADYLQAISGLDDTDFWEAIMSLRKSSLLEVRGTTQKKRYGIHRLTQTYLQKTLN